MKPTKTHEERLLGGASNLVQRFVIAVGGNATEARYQILEAAASRVGGFDLQGFQKAFGIQPLASVGRLIDAAQGVVAAIRATDIPPALALSALAREEVAHAQKRATGVYNTDYRLAQHLASTVRDVIRPGVRILDPACGAGMLLAAVSIVACGADRVLAADWLRESVNAADLNEGALRGALLSLASLTDDLSALQVMRRRWVVQDSLLAPAREWKKLAPEGFDIIVANPPWEKVKLSRHEFIKRRGGARHYGASYEGQDLTGYETDRLDAVARSAALAELYPALASGEPDLYVAFTELMLRLTKPGGSGAILIPGGVIRSQGTESLRRLLLERSHSLSFTVI
jgi:predicted RNA methylase